MWITCSLIMIIMYPAFRLLLSNCCCMWYTFIVVISTRREQDIFDVLPAVKWCAPGRSFESFESMPREVLNEDFGGEHRGFIGDLQPHLQALVVEATELLELCIRAPYAKGEERRGMCPGGGGNGLEAWIFDLDTWIFDDFSEEQLHPRVRDLRAPAPELPGGGLSQEALEVERGSRRRAWDSKGLRPS